MRISFGLIQILIFCRCTLDNFLTLYRFGKGSLIGLYLCRNGFINLLGTCCGFRLGTLNQFLGGNWRNLLLIFRARHLAWMINVTLRPMNFFAALSLDDHFLEFRFVCRRSWSLEDVRCIWINLSISFFI